MDTQTIDGVTLYYDADEKHTAIQLASAIESSVQTISGTWNLPAPKDCRVYLMVSWPRCVFLGAPLGSQILLGVTLPFWYREFRIRWEYAGGWSQRYGTRQVVGIKAPRLIADTQETMGRSIFVNEDDQELRYLSIVCHELTHAFSAHLLLPGWLNEGLAMVCADQCLGKQTVLQSTLELLNTKDAVENPTDRIDLRTQSREQVILLYVRGYWLTRYLMEQLPGFLPDLLADSLPGDGVEARIAKKLGVYLEGFWQQVDPLVAGYFTPEIEI